jgi:sugar O-acyltransferase (sialic acid O-acetyltransferase NeuD family)
MSIILYGIGSMIVVDVAETCGRLGLKIAAWVKNVEGKTYEPEGQPVIAAADLSAELTALEFAVPLFTPAHRLKAAADAELRGLRRPRSLIDPTAIVASSTTFGVGCYANSAATVGAAGKIGQFVFINRSASIGHHAEIADYVSIGPGAVIAGNVRLGRGAVVAAGAIVLPSLEVGDNAVVAAGAVVTESVPPHCMVAGNPARVIKSGIAGYNDHSV